MWRYKMAEENLIINESVDNMCKEMEENVGEAQGKFQNAQKLMQKVGFNVELMGGIIQSDAFKDEEKEELIRKIVVNTNGVLEEYGFEVS